YVTVFFFFQAEDGIRDGHVTGVQCALPIFALESADLPELRTMADKIIKEVVAVQEPSGYLNTYYVGDRAKDRMTPEVQRWGHELYNIGHLLQGAIAYYRATGDSTLLEAGIHFVDGFLLPNFGPGPDKKPIFSGHPEMRSEEHTS